MEFLQRFFERLDSLIIQDWIDAEPTGQYARRIALLYEWLTDKHLRVPDNIGGNYVDALSNKWLVTSSPKTVEKNSRWRVNDNLAGNRDFCPTIIKTAQLNQAASLDVAQSLVNLTNEFGEDLLMRSSVWLTLRESKGSFKIEGEGKHMSRIARFADVITHQTGQGDLPINGHASGILQHAILGDSVVISEYGLRQSPVFVGQTHRFQEIVHYIAPPHAMLANKLDAS